MTASLNSYARLLGGDVYVGRRIMCPGPGHSRNDRSLSVTFRLDGGFVTNSFSGDDWKQCRDHVKAALGIDGQTAAPVAFNDNRLSQNLDRLRKSQDALAIWARSTPIAGTLAETYMASRGLTYSGDAIRFFPGGRAMVALMTDAVTNEPCGIHRTFLDGNGKKVERKMLGRAAGAVVRLSGDEGLTYGLGIAEGIETALAAPFRPMWACLSAGTMKALPVLSGIEALSIFADQDRAGLDAANTCGERWHAAGVEVTIAEPIDAGADFADLVREAA